MPNALAYGAKVIDAEVAVSGGGGTGGGHVIEDDGTALTQRDTLNFIGFDAEDDSTNSKTQIAEHELTQDELAEIMSTPPGPSVPTDFDDLDNRPTVDVTPMSEIITPVPSVSARRFKYSTDEQIVGEWIDGKPIYQKTIELPQTTTATTVGSRRDFVFHLASDIANFGEIINFDGYILYNNTTTTPESSMTINVKGTFIGTSLTVNATCNMYLSGDLHFDVSKDISNKVLGGIVTIQYTKTTD